MGRLAGRTRAAMLVATARLAGACMVASACGGDASSLPGAMVADSAGTRIVTYDLSDVVVPEYRSVGALDLEIGAQDGAPEYTFSQIPDLAVAEDGSIVVTDAVAAELRVYDAAGTWLRTLGQKGDGPGEFSSAPHVAGLEGDTVFAWDGRSGRVTALTLAGELLEMTTLRSGSGRAPLLVSRLADGTYLAQSMWIVPGAGFEGPHDARLELDSVVIEHIDGGGATLDTVRVLPDQERATAVETPGQGVVRVMAAPRPYSPQAIMSTDGSGLLLGHNATFELALRREPTATPTMLRVLGTENPATASDIRAHMEELILERGGPEALPVLTRRLYDEFLPERLPAFGRVVVSDVGDAWISHSELDSSAGVDWLVFSMEGELRGRVHTPVGLRLLAVRGSSLYGVALDDLDVPYVRRYPLAAPVPAA